MCHRLATRPKETVEHHTTVKRLKAQVVGTYKMGGKAKLGKKETEDLLYFIPGTQDTSKKHRLDLQTSKPRERHLLSATMHFKIFSTIIMKG